MRLDENPALPRNPESEYDRQLYFTLAKLFRNIAQKVNSIADGDIAAFDNAYTAAPTSGTWRQGDSIRNSAPSELGSVGSKYVITGWQCVASGTPGTWVQLRSLTGN